MVARDPAIDALLAAARAQFAASLPAKIASLDAAVVAAAWEEARREAHKLRGSAATYGFPALGVLAGAIEDLLPRGGVPGADDRALLARHLAEARVEADRAAAGSA